MSIDLSQRPSIEFQALSSPRLQQDHPPLLIRSRLDRLVLDNMMTESDGTQMSKEAELVRSALRRLAMAWDQVHTHLKEQML